MIRKPSLSLSTYAIAARDVTSLLSTDILEGIEYVLSRASEESRIGNMRPRWPAI
jgi:hypothetical protein